jgi:predicted MPP superfamily phosphohydrolase
MAFTYLYLALCFYILPAFAFVLKIRARKLSQISSDTGVNDITTSSGLNFLFLENVLVKFNSLFFVRKQLPMVINNLFSNTLVKNESFSNFNFSILNQLKIVTFFM